MFYRSCLPHKPFNSLNWIEFLFVGTALCLLQFFLCDIEKNTNNKWGQVKYLGKKMPRNKIGTYIGLSTHVRKLKFWGRCKLTWMRMSIAFAKWFFVFLNESQQTHRKFDPISIIQSWRFECAYALWHLIEAGARNCGKIDHFDDLRVLRWFETKVIIQTLSERPLYATNYGDSMF